MRLLVPLMLLALALPASAQADTRYATTTGSGTLCGPTSACTLVQAIAGASTGDEIVVASGSYPSITSSGVGSGTADLDIHGRPGEAFPLIPIATNPGSCGIYTGPGSHVENIELRLDAAQSRGLCIASGALVEHIIVGGSVPNVRGIVAGNSSENVLIRDSVVRLPGANTDGIGLFNFDGTRLRNVTVAAADGIEVNGDTDNSLSVRNSIVFGSAAAFRLFCAADTSEIVVDHSAYNAAGSTCTFTPGTGNVAYAGVQLSNDNVTQQLASNTDDAGVADPANSPTDIHGDPRPMGTAIDIGADELRAAPTATTQAATAVTQTTAVLAGVVDGRGAGVTRRFDFGPTTNYDDSTTDPSLTGLAAGTTYHFRVVATNQFGMETKGDDLTFTTPPAPPPPVDPGPAPGASPDGPGGSAESPRPGPVPGSTPAADRTPPACTQLKLKRRRGRTTLSGRCSEAATLKVVVREGRRRRTRRLSVRAGSFKVRIGGRRVKRAVVTASDAAGNAALPQSLRRP